MHHIMVSCAAVVVAVMLVGCATEKQVSGPPVSDAPQGEDQQADGSESEPEVDEVDGVGLDLVDDDPIFADWFIEDESGPEDVPIAKDKSNDKGKDPDQGDIDKVTIKNIQSSPDSLECQVLYGSMLVGVDIQLKKVIVSAPAYLYQPIGEKLDGFYVMDEGGGPYSGIHATFPVADMPNLKIGQVLTLMGDHKEAHCFSIYYAKSILVEGSGDGSPQAYLTTPQEIEDDPEALEGVLVRVENVTVTNANPDAVQGSDFQEFEVDGLLRVGNDYELSYMNPSTDVRKEGDVFDYIVGVVKFDADQFHLMPRKNGDMLLQGEQPPVDEVVVETVEDIVEQPEEVVEQTEVIEEPVEIVEEIDVREVIEDIPDTTEDADVPIEPDLPPEDVPLDVPVEADSPIVITEIMYDPVEIPDDKGEWFELYNASEEAIDINGWRIEDDAGQMHIIMNGGPYVIASGQALVFANNAIESTNGGLEVDYQYPYVDFSLDNTQDTVTIKNIYGEPVDTVHYNEQSGWMVAKGATLELIHPNLDNSDTANWQVATVAYGDGSNLGTPAEVPQ